MPHYFEPPPATASFSAPQPDLSIQLPDEPAPWMDRWGRKLFAWTLVVILVGGVAGAGWWLYGDSQVESTLAMVADQTPATAPEAAAFPPPVAHPPAPVPEPIVNAAEPEPVSGALDPGESVEPPIAQAAPPPAPAPVMAAPAKPRKKAAAPAARRGAEKRTPARTLARREAPPARALAPQPARPPVATEAQAQPAGDALSETLRLCRAAGYHATLCIKRGCSATKFGLVCRG